MSEGPRILFLSPWPSFWEGGVRVGCSDEDELYQALLREGFDVHYVLPRVRGVEPPGPPTHFHFGPAMTTKFEALPSGLRRPLRYWGFGLIYERLALRVAREVRPHLVVGESYYAARPAVRVARRLRLPSVTKFFGVMTLARRENAAWHHRLRHWETVHALRAPADRVVVLDDGTRGDEAALHYGVPRERLCFWPNGLDTDFRTRVPRRARDTLRAGIGFSPEHVVIVSLCRLVDNKRVDLALEALTLVDRSLPYRMLVLGDGPQRLGLEAMSRQLGLKDRVVFAGSREHDEVFEWLRASDVFLSTSDLTNRSLSTLEAMLCGLPVVAADSGATRDLVGEGSGGIVVPGAPRDIAEALTRLVRDAALRERLSRESRSASAKFPGWQERTSREIALYRELLGAR